MAEYTKRRNVNRGYMKLDVWQKGIELYKLVWHMVSDAKIDYKLRGQISDATQSVSANIAEGYSRRSIKEYLQHLYIALGSLSESLSRMIAFYAAGQITPEQFEQFDALYYEVENKLWNLVRSLEEKKLDGTWIDHVSEDTADYTIYQSDSQGKQPDDNPNKHNKDSPIQ
ncbi:MAG: four helix bundle protein [Ignavibacteriae bacterium]|nr:four helix bundle protein [Ignavibacteriota bacterium]